MNKWTTVEIINRGAAYIFPSVSDLKEYGAKKLANGRDPPGLEKNIGRNWINTGILGTVVSSKDDKTLVYLPKYDKEVLIGDDWLAYYKYKKWDRVKYVSGIHGYWISNPKNTIGVVKRLTKNRLPIDVEWWVGVDNSYWPEDLQLVIDAPAKVFGPTYLYLEDDLKLYDTVEFGNLKYTVLKDHLSLQGKAKSGLENEEIFNVLGITEPEAWVERPYWYTPIVSGHRPYYNDHDYKAASRAVDLLIYQLKQMTPDLTTEPVIKVRGKVIKFDKVDPLIQQANLSDATPQDMTDQEMLDIMEAAIKALEKGEALTPEQQAAMQQMWQPQQQPQQSPQQQPKPYLFVFQLGMPTDVRNYITQPVESFGDALKEFNDYVDTQWRASSWVVILNVLS
jgi:hypothetical protein